MTSKSEEHHHHEGYMHRIMKLLISGGGIYCVYLYYGLLQEKIFKTNYAEPKMPHAEKFQGGVFLVFFQSFLSFVLAKAVCYIIPSSTKFITNKEAMKLSLFNFLSMFSSNTALAFVSYPVQALMKSAKVLSILLVGFASGCRDYSKIQYACAILITAGIFIFQHLEQNSKASDKTTSYFGLALLLTSLFSDGMLADVQREVNVKNKEKHNHMNSFELMAATNQYCFMLCFVYAIFNSQLEYIYNYVSNYPAIIKDLINISLLGVVGQIFIFYVIRHFGPVILAIITTTRKFFTVIASILYYKHSLSLYQWMCVLIVFLGVSAELYDGIQRKKHDYNQITNKDNAPPKNEIPVKTKKI